MISKRTLLGSAVGFGLVAGLSTSAMADTITVATVNNGDMIRMQQLSPQWEKETGHTIEWVVLEENTLRQRVTQDIATKGGQFDVMTIGTYEVPIWAKQDWLVPLENMPDGYDADDILPSIAGGLSVDGTLYAAPFYGESSMVMYRTDLMEKAGMEMPDEPTWTDIAKAAEAMHDGENEIYGICLRGKPGWGENTAFLTTMANSFGARWFDMDWKPQFDSPEWKESFTTYLDLMNKYGPPGAASNGFNENLSLFQQGKCGMWIDATVAASFVTNPDDSQVADSVGFTLAPNKEGVEKRANWLWAWSLAIPAGTDAEQAAKDFVAWATSKDYTEIVAEKEGWANVPPGTRTSLYENQDYLDAAPFAKMTLQSIELADPTSPTVEEVPYTGVQFVAIPEFQGIGTAVGQALSAALAGQSSAEEALAQAQSITQREMSRAGYGK
ncbi:sugar ABC transporter substrate-binding protein [Notoacmeibacter marinus]|uniref:Sugar ABC transporter substrate-binding protein n=1 Tax=Notoacmeibacter marinus TaxID=1876515 RepID=A0A231UXI1_9HYPH|nr:sugar ABC transporter substrate-binding protein [Notoacmeibacter marinus]OXT00594.1 sugar ABC transporter substrate-binding protein [Notoacmeibacter marinus]